MAAYSLNRRAEEDIRRLYRYGIERFGFVQADSYFDGLFGRFDAIAEAPTLYPKVDHIRPATAAASTAFIPSITEQREHPSKSCASSAAKARTP